MDVIFDLDGTLADLSHRRHWVERKPKNWGRFFSEVHLDKPIADVIKLWFHLSEFHTMYIVSGRSEECRKDTEDWLIRHWLSDRCTNLYMRKQGDYRRDDIVKQEILDAHWPGDRKKDIFAVFDDRDRVVNMWRANGLRCYQVAPGNF